MRYGCTLPLDLFTPTPSEASAALIKGFGDTDALFAWLGDNLDGIELGTVRTTTDPELLLHAVSVCRGRGLTVTIHGAMAKEDTDSFFAPYLPLFAAGLQDSYNITLHPLREASDTRDMLRALLAVDHPVTFTLENQRNRSAETAGWGCAPVAAMVAEIGDRRLGTCLDFGHQLSNFRKFGPEQDPIPQAFYALAGHTHIHSYHNGTTHFPLHAGETLLEEHIAALRQAGYTGILNLELHAERYHMEFDVREALERSIAILKDGVTQLVYKEKAHAAYRDRFPETLAKVADFVGKTEGSLGLIGPASYLLHLGGKKIAIDPSACHFPGEEEKREALFHTLLDYDGVICTHFHFDHYDGALLTRLAPHLPCYIPAYMPPLPGVNRVNAGDRLTFEEVALTFFDSPHSRGENKVEELGFLLEYDGRRHLFPVDVRTYDPVAIPVAGPVDTLISHLWLGRVHALDRVAEADYIEEFCAFAGAFTPKRTILGHLCDSRRTITDMWSPLHVERVAPYLTNPTPLQFGDTITL